MGAVIPLKIFTPFNQALLTPPSGVVTKRYAGRMQFLMLEVASIGSITLKMYFNYEINITFLNSVTFLIILTTKSKISKYIFRK